MADDVKTIKVLTDRLDRFEDEMRKHYDKTRTLVDTLANNGVYIESVSNEQRNLNKAVTGYEAKIKALAARVEAMVKELEALRKDAASMTDLGQLRKAVEALSKERDAADKRCDALEKRLAALEKARK